MHFLKNRNNKKKKEMEKKKLYLEINICLKRLFNLDFFFIAIDFPKAVLFLE